MDSKAVKAKPALHVLNAVSDQSVVNAVIVVIAASAQTVIALPVKAAVMAVHPGVVRTWLKASATTA